MCKKQIAYQVNLIRDTMEHLPNLEYFGKDLQKAKMKSDVEFSDKSWKNLSAYSEELL
jgi:hypothetical protein